VPAACSPSLKVVSNTAIFDVAFMYASSDEHLDLPTKGEQPNYLSIPQQGFKE
jgi:hypothetical protein